MPFITHTIWNKVFHSVKNPSINARFGLRNALKIGTGFAKLAVNAAAYWTYSYLCEKQADEGVVNDQEVLEAMATEFRKDHMIDEKMKKRSWRDRFEIAIDEHPNPLKRAQRFEERAAQLRAAQQKIYSKFKNLSLVKSQAF